MKTFLGVILVMITLQQISQREQIVDLQIKNDNVVLQIDSLEKEFIKMNLDHARINNNVKLIIDDGYDELKLTNRQVLALQERDRQLNPLGSNLHY